MSHAIRLEVTGDNVALVTFDQADRKVNALTREFLGQLSEIVAKLEQGSTLRGALFQSGKPGQFVAGADLNEMAALVGSPREDIDRVLDLGNDVFNRIAALPYPSAALISGPCLGGGLEFALAMDGRLASSSPKTVLGFPETKIGLIPGWGGTQRLPRLIGEAAISLIGSGESISAARALELGLVDAIVPADRLLERGVQWLETVRENGSWLERRAKIAGTCSFEQSLSQPPRDEIRGDVATSRGVHRARLTAFETMKAGVCVPLQEALAIEREASHGLFGSSDSANLISVFFLKSRRAKDSGIDDPAIDPRAIGRVGILGAGQMGAGIAEAHANVGIPVVLVDIDNDRLENGINRVRGIQDRRERRNKIPADAWKDVLDRIKASTDIASFSECDLVIEAVTENEAIKSEMFRKLKSVLAPTAIVASNTSTIPIGRMAASTPDPTRFAGMHFFHPVERMELVEIIRGPESGDEAITTLVALSKRLGKIPIVVRDCPGFLTTRLLAFYLREAVRLIEEGVNPTTIDQEIVRFGMPMGPIALMDFIGLDTVQAIFNVMASGYSGRFEPSPLVVELVKSGRLGRKSGMGFCPSDGRVATTDPILDHFRNVEREEARTVRARIDDRLFLTMLLEATRVLDERIVREPADIDLGVILGLAFPAYRGGLLRWADGLGAREVVARLTQLEDLGERFRPTERLKRMVETSTTFYP